MFAMPGARAFALSPARGRDGVFADADGVFVGGIPLLRRAGQALPWSVRPIAEINKDLGARYGLPVDFASKAHALSLIASALNRRDVGMAAIAAVQMQIPDPPSLAGGRETHEEVIRRAAALRRSSLLKADWDPALHPRDGVPPNPGWFAPVSQGEDGSTQVAMDINHGKPPPAPIEGGGPADDGDLFGGKLPFQFAPYAGGKTYGAFQTPDGKTVMLESGSQGPAANMPPGSLGFDGVTRLHVEGHAAALMWKQGINDATLYINNPEICDSCMSLLPRMLPPGATLRVIVPNGSVTEFKGIPR
jgi:hypothetical protein